MRAFFQYAPHHLGKNLVQFDYHSLIPTVKYYVPQNELKSYCRHQLLMVEKKVYVGTSAQGQSHLNLVLKLGRLRKANKRLNLWEWKQSSRLNVEKRQIYH